MSDSRVKFTNFRADQLLPGESYKMTVLIGEKENTILITVIESRSVVKDDALRKIVLIAGINQELSPSFMRERIYVWHLGGGAGLAPLRFDKVISVEKLENTSVALIEKLN